MSSHPQEQTDRNQDGRAAGGRQSAGGDAQPSAAAAGRHGASTGHATSSTSSRKFPHKVSFYQAPEDTSRVRAALLHTQGAEGGRSLSAFIHGAVMKETRRLERKYNDGQPWSGVDARGIPQGRPLDT